MIIKRKLFAKKNKHFLSWRYIKPNVKDLGYNYYKENVFDKFSIETEDDLEKLDLQYSGDPHTYKHYQRWIKENKNK